MKVLQLRGSRAPTPREATSAKVTSEAAALGVSTNNGTRAAAAALSQYYYLLCLGGASTATVGGVSPTPGIPRPTAHHTTVNGVRAVLRG